MTSVGQAGREVANARTSVERRQAARKARKTRASRVRVLVKTLDGSHIWADVPKEYLAAKP